MSALKAAQSNACLLANYSLETDALKAQIGQLTRDLREEQGEREKLRGLVNAGQSNWDQLRLEARGLQGKVHDLEAQNTVLKHQLDEATRRLQVMTLTADQEASRPALLFADQRCFSDSKEQRSMPSTCTGYLHRHPHAHAQGSLSSKGFY
jgi:septal ring factor EnvC (AmiA/AmiB activator)